MQVSEAKLGVAGELWIWLHGTGIPCGEPMIIRRTPEDFRVTEHLTPQATTSIAPEDGAWEVWKLTKQSLTTPDAVGLLAKSLGIKPGQIEYAGLKDKHAITTQYISIPRNAAVAVKGKTTDVAASPVVPRTVQAIGAKHNGRGWDAELLGFAPAPLLAAAIEKNHFQIVVREMTQRDVREMGRRASIIKSGNSLFVPNYFGDQRFSGVKNIDSFAAPHLITNDFESALKLMIATPSRKDAGQKKDFTRLAATHWGDWKRLCKVLPRCQEYGAIEVLSNGGTFAAAFSELPYLDQQMAVESFQSYIWNLTLRSLCRVHAHATPKRTFSTPDPFGELIFVAPEVFSPELTQLQIPLLASTSTLKDPWKNAAIEALKAAEVKLQQLRVPELRRPQFGEAMRPAFVYATEFALGVVEKDDLGREDRSKRLVSFNLPRGSYATVVLRALGQ